MDDDAAAVAVADNVPAGYWDRLAQAFADAPRLSELVIDETEPIV